MFVMGKLVFQHVYESAIEHGHNVQPGDNAAAGFHADEQEEWSAGSGSGGYLPYDPFPTPSGGKACFGAACFRPTALIGCGLSVAAVGAAVLLVCRTSEQYRKLWAPKSSDGSNDYGPVHHRHNYTRELAAQREEDYRRQREKALGSR
jgi:hypothetical protein